MKVQLNSPSTTKTGDVIVQNSALTQLESYLRNYAKCVFVIDSGVAKHWKEKIRPFVPASASIIEIDASEQSKNLETYQKILEGFNHAGIDRSGIAISIGGGVASDLVGFAASSYMRGVNWIAVPTTLTAQADAAIGGKTGVNLSGYKNLVGSFWPPIAVISDPEFLSTLDERQMKSGLAEIIKMGIIYDSQILDLLNSVDPSVSPSEELYEALGIAAKSKVEIVNRDLHETGERKLLNFGHTLGHAIEALSHETDQPLTHGEAISVGMVGESILAELEGLCSHDLRIFVVEILNKYGLPTNYKTSADQIIAKVSLDKKNDGGKVMWTLPETFGKGTFNHQATEENITQAINSILG